MSNFDTLCAFCFDPCSLACANCKKVAYCSKNHQKFDRKAHKPICYPAKLEWSESLGNHLLATRDISELEVILEDRPIIVGPLSNLPKSAQICLGCCNLIPQNDSFECPTCHWLMCRPFCHQNSWHRDNECEIFKSNRITRATVPDEFLFVTILRCVLVKLRNPEVWKKLERFEFHGESRRERIQHRDGMERSLSATNFIKNRCNQDGIDVEDIDRIYGILTVNGYSDGSKYYIKLYEIGSKISHSCLPNTRSMSKTIGTNGEVVSSVDSKLTVICTSRISAGQTLTQLYGGLELTGTHRRQELLQSIYLFTCSCSRCLDPSEFGTNFSGIACQTKKCRQEGNFVLPLSPQNLSSAWTCAKCEKKWNYKTLVFPALREVAEVTQMTVDDPFFSEFEFYSQSNPSVPLNGPEIIPMKVEYILKMDDSIEKLGKDVVHPNHYSLLPAKTAVIATIYTLIGRDATQDRNIIKDHQQCLNLAKIFLKTVKNVLGITDLLSPGMVRNNGILLFYFARGLQILQQLEPELETKNKNEIKNIWTEAERILLLEPKSDEFRQLLEKSQINSEQ